MVIDWHVIESIAIELFSIEEFLYLVEHGLYIAEGAVDASKTDIGDLVHQPQTVHN